MYANIDNPPPPVPARSAAHSAPRLDPDKQLCSLSRISRLLTLISCARERIAYSQHQYDTHSFLSSPFVSRARRYDDILKWTYITCRLERYYFKKLCELNSTAYHSLIDNG